MPSKTRPTTGVYRLTTTSPSTSVLYGIGAVGVYTTFGILEWVQDGSPAGNGHYQRGDIGITFYDDGTFVAVNGSESYSGTWALA